MKIAIVLGGPLVANGACRVVAGWSRVLSEAGHEVALIHEVGSSPYPLSVRSLGYRPVPGVPGRVPARSLAAARVLVEQRRRRGVDLAILHDPLLGVAARRALPDTPLIQTFHSPFFDENRLNNWTWARPWPRRLAYPLTAGAAWLADRMALRAVDAVHTLSDYTWKRLCQRHPRGCAGKRHARIPGSVDVARFRPAGNRALLRRRLGLSAEGPVLLSVRRLIPRNGVDRILASAPDLCGRFPGLRILVVGTGPLEGELRREVERRGLGERVRLTGLVAESELVDFYRAADALLLPTRALECFGMPVVEAMACGCTPLVMPDGAPPELLPDPACVAAANTTGAFVALVTSFLSGEIPRRSARLAQHARSHFSDAAIRPALLSLVQEVAGPLARSRPGEPDREPEAVARRAV